VAKHEEEEQELHVPGVNQSGVKKRHLHFLEEVYQMRAVFPGVFLVDSSVSRRFSLFHLKIGRSLAQSGSILVKTLLSEVKSSAVRSQNHSLSPDKLMLHNKCARPKFDPIYLYWLLETSVRESDSLGFHDPSLSLGQV
jgi:hypothetical protein